MPGVRITFVGSGKPLEARHVRAAGFESIALPCRPFPRRAREAIPFLADHITGYYAARTLLREQSVALVVGLGGYASVPAARAAARGHPRGAARTKRGAGPGHALVGARGGADLFGVRRNSVASQIGQPRPRDGQPAAARVHRARRRYPPIARPARLEAQACRAGWQRRCANAQRAGSLGAVQGRRSASRLADRAPKRPARRGAGGRAVRAAWNHRHRVAVRRQHAAAAGASQLAVSRAGGTTLAELAASGVPAILLPFPRAVDDHQRKNADVFAAAGAARTLDERQPLGRLDNQLASAVVELTTDHAERYQMAQAMGRLARPRATAAVVRAITAIVAARGQPTG